MGNPTMRQESWTVRAAAGLVRLLTPTAAKVYNASVVVGVVLAGVGAERWFGYGAGLLVAGLLVLALAIYSAERGGER